MSSKLFVLAVALAVLASVGCTGMFVPKAQYDRDVNQLREYNAALERDNAMLRPTKDAYERLKAQADYSVEANKAWEEMAAALKKALDGIAVEPGDFIIDRKTGAFIFGTDLLFESGSFEISAKGKAALKAFADLNHGRQLKIVGHTDSKKVVKVGTKKNLPLPDNMDNNLELSAMRAIFVMAELTRNGVAERSMTIEGKGSLELRGNDRDSRRVEIFIVGGTPGAAPAKAPTSVKAAHKTVNK